jgi:predicted unusual protein kinase regulating ubiquinone biosynthesis (AarF/ABC1/UbiB family)
VFLMKLSDLITLRWLDRLQDLKNARTIVQWVAWAEPDYNFGPVMDEWCNEVPKELNFKLEAGTSHSNFFY